MLTMLLGGLWHGASWNFVFWGGLHGLYLMVHHAVTGKGEDLQRAVPLWRAGAQAAVMFALVSFTWVFFRSPDYATTLTYLEGLLRFSIAGGGAALPVLILAGLTLSVDLPQAVADDEFVLLRWPVAARAALASAGAILFLISGTAQHEPFIYFQF